PRWITPDQDRFENAEHDRWNRKVLDAIRAGADVGALIPEYARAAQVDSQFRALAFLAGSGACDGQARVLEYGPVWGTGAAVVTWLDGT
ncbi:MAG: 2-amino-5-chlorophenol 1,6-dioxygenase subunit alpha, partial [Actinomycetota bacterium]